MHRIMVGLLAATSAGLLALATFVRHDLVWIMIAAGAVSTGLAACLALGPVEKISYGEVMRTRVRRLDRTLRKPIVPVRTKDPSDQPVVGDELLTAAPSNGTQVDHSRSRPSGVLSCPSPICGHDLPIIGILKCPHCGMKVTKAFRDFALIHAVTLARQAISPVSSW